MNATTSWSAGRGHRLNVLVAYASRHGATAEIAKVIAEELGFALGSATAELRCLPAADVSSVDDFDVVVVGSALYYGRWPHEGRAFLARFETDLADRDVWLFSSGPLERLDPDGQSSRPAVISTAVGAREHKLFAGRLQLEALSRVERTVTRLVHGPAGDFRDFGEIRRWARRIADETRQERPAHSA